MGDRKGFFGENSGIFSSSYSCSCSGTMVVDVVTSVCGLSFFVYGVSRHND